ncbi:MAG: ribonuclease P protein component [Cyclobacteriaceae bacterium]
MQLEQPPHIDRSFSKKERLNSKKLIEELFKNGSSFYLDVVQFKVLAREKLENNQVLISVPKKHHKKAVSRNLIKRRIREAYRLNKHRTDPSSHYLIGIIYLSKEILTYHQIEKKLITFLSRLSGKSLDKHRSK